MTSFAPVEPGAATGKAADLLAQVHKSLGRTSNMTKVMANSPALLHGYLALSGAVSGGVLTPPVRERLAIATAELNGANTACRRTYIGANIAKVDADELVKARRGDSHDPHVAALLKLSNTTADNAGDVDEVDIKTAREAGVAEEEIGEVVANLALNILTNYFNVLAHVDNDWPIVALRTQEK